MAYMTLEKRYIFKKEKFMNSTIPKKGLAANYKFIAFIWIWEEMVTDLLR